MTAVIDVPQTKVVSNHGLLLYFTPWNGSPILVAGIFQWDDNQSRQITPMWDFGNSIRGENDVQAISGEPFEAMPGNTSNTTVTINRYDVYTKRFEQAFGTRDLDMLTKQKAPLRAEAFIHQPDNTLLFTRTYYGVWFQTKGTRHDAKGDRIVQVNATAFFTRLRDSKTGAGGGIAAPGSVLSQGNG